MALIDLTYLSGNFDISSNAGKVAEEQIENAELLELRPLLGQKLYLDLIANPSDAQYVALLDGGEYEYENFTYTNPGVKKVLGAFAAARVRMFGNDKSTPFGNVEKLYNDARPTSRDRGKERYTDGRKIAEALWADVALFLTRSKTDTMYKYWNYGYDCDEQGTPRTRSGLKIRHVR